MSKSKNSKLNLMDVIEKAFPDFFVSIQTYFNPHPSFYTIELTTQYGHVYKVEVTMEEIQKVGDTPESIGTVVQSKLYASYPGLAIPVYPAYPKGKSGYEIDWYDSKKWDSPQATPKKDIQKAMDSVAANDEWYYSPLVAQDSVNVKVNSDLTQLSKGIDEVFKKLAVVAKTMGAEFAQAAEVMGKTLNELNKILEQKQLAVAPGQTITTHPGMKQYVLCPDVNCYSGYRKVPTYLNTIIVHLNDSHTWTREQIADWLDTLDEQPVFYPKVDDGEALAESA